MYVLSVEKKKCVRNILSTSLKFPIPPLSLKVMPGRWSFVALVPAPPPPPRKKRQAPEMWAQACAYIFRLLFKLKYGMSGWFVWYSGLHDASFVSIHEILEQSMASSLSWMAVCLLLCFDIKLLITFHRIMILNSGLSISSVRRPGLGNLALGPASRALNKSSGLVCPYLSNQWSESKVWPINSHLRFMGSSFLRSPNTSKKASMEKFKNEF